VKNLVNLGLKLKIWTICSLEESLARKYLNNLGWGGEDAEHEDVLN
jgi:hypothetical protein